MQTKPIHCFPLEKLYLLPIPNIRWKTISVDFIMELPEPTGFDMVMMVVDSISKKTYFIPAYTIVIAEDTIRLFLHHI